MKNLASRKNSIFIRILVPMLCLLVVQSALFAGTLLWGGTISTINENAVQMLGEKVLNRKSYLQNEMLNRWSNLETTVDSVQKIVAAHTDSPQKLETEETLAVPVITETVDVLISCLRKNSVTGAFVVFGSADSGAQQKYGYYIRDLDPISGTDGVGDLLVVRSPIGVVQARPDLAVGTRWETKFDFSGGEEARETQYFTKPFRAAQQYGREDYRNLGYWSDPFHFIDPSQKFLTYSVPLVDGEGNPYGVLGIDVSEDYLKKLMPYQELDSESGGAYVLAVRRSEEASFDAVLRNGTAYTSVFGGAEKVELSDAVYGGYRVANGNPDYGAAVSCVEYFTLYNTNTPFAEDRWALIAVMNESRLFAFSAKVRVTVFIAIAASVLLGILAVVLVSYWLTDPIRKLIAKVRAKHSSGSMKLNRTKITEIDELVSAIETLSENVAESSAKLSRIMDAANVPLGAFEVDRESGALFYTDQFFAIIGRKDLADKKIELADFKRVLEQFESNLAYVQEDTDARVYQFIPPAGSVRWVQLKIVEENARVLGIVQDVTGEVLERRKIEHERDYDLLTNLLNRRTFQTAVTRLLDSGRELDSGVFLIMDIDNLKYVNNTFGYDYGDEYIKLAAHVLTTLAPDNSVIARTSDEFYLFLYGYTGPEEAERAVEELRTVLKNTELRLPEENRITMRVSAGYAHYPGDSTYYDELFRYADFALYESKNFMRGEFAAFNVANYNESSYLLHNREELNKLIEQELVEYHFQPIVEAATGKVYGYEALMRSKLSTIKNPQEILSLARSQSKLAKIEHLTWFKAMEEYARHAEELGEKRIFVNSISSQILSDEEVAELERRYGKYLGRVVMEFTEDEKLNEQYMQKKRGILKRWNGRVALDDFGTGYNGDVVLLTLNPNFIKIDMSIVRNIDRDDNRKSLFENILHYAKERKIKVIAEGIENREEMEAVVRSGVDYLQGFYLGRPEPCPQKIPRQVKRELAAIREQM